MPAHHRFSENLDTFTKTFQTIAELAACTGQEVGGSRLRARMKLLVAEPIDNGGMQITWEVTVEREGFAKPVCVAQSLVRRYP